jgi:hypothetical protein
MIALIYFNTPEETAKVSLPSSPPEDTLPSGSPTGGTDINSGLIGVEINTKTVQTAISTLNGRKATSAADHRAVLGKRRKSEYRINVWVSGPDTRIIVEQDGIDSQNFW